MFKFLAAHETVEHIFPEPPADGDPIALAIVLVFFAIFIIWVIARKNKSAAPEVVEEIVEAEPSKAPGSAGQLKLYNVEPKTAAMVMAIVADKTGKPLNELRFLSIKEVE